MNIPRLASASTGSGIGSFVSLTRFGIVIVALAVALMASARVAAQAASIPSGSPTVQEPRASPSPSAPASSVAETRSPEEQAILAVVDQFMTGISTNDFALLARIRLENSLNIVERPAAPPTPGMVITRRPFNPEGSKPGVFKERYWDPLVHVRGGLAIVWTPYEFWRDGETSHCGIDVFEMVKEQGIWKIGNAMWTVEPDGCPSLRPSDPSRLRPTR
jgi:hypothetical protein